MGVPEVTVYPARLVRTMDPSRPTGEAVAVIGDRIRAVGSMAEMEQYPGIRIDDRYRDQVLFPGFVEAHTHPFGGLLWNFPYVGYYQAMSPDGRVWEGCKSITAVVDRLREAQATLAPGEALFAWGLDPIFFPGERLDKRHLDSVSAERPIVIQHVSGHMLTVNSAVLKGDNITRDTPVEGVAKGPDGEPNGELQEPAAMSLVVSAPSLNQMASVFNAAGMMNFALDARNHGATTVCDLGNPWLGDPSMVDAFRQQVDSDEFPARINAFLMAGGFATYGSDPAQTAQFALSLREASSEKLRFGHIKLVLDGSIQGFTARLQAPGYLPDDRTGIWVMAPETFAETFQAYHDAGLTVHVHCNGDQATELFIDSVEQALERHPRWNHRHTVTHSQLTTPAQYRRMAALGMCANIFSNHIWYWGDQHRDVILGPDRAARMDAAATALRYRVPFAFHCDSPVTPIDPLASASYAAERVTASGKVLGEFERITVPQALEAMTIGASYLLKMDHEVGSIEAGKFADFAVLDADPYTAEPAALRDIKVHGTVVGGRHHPVTG